MTEHSKVGDYELELYDDIRKERLNCFFEYASR